MALALSAHLTDMQAQGSCRRWFENKRQLRQLNAPLDASGTPHRRLYREAGDCLSCVAGSSIQCCSQRAAIVSCALKLRHRSVHLLCLAEIELLLQQHECERQQDADGVALTASC